MEKSLAQWKIQQSHQKVIKIIQAIKVLSIQVLNQISIETEVLSKIGKKLIKKT